MLTAFKIFQQLPGTWQFSRVITNYRYPMMSGNIKEGIATFTIDIKDQNRLQYHEQGVFICEAMTNDTHKDYSFTYNQEHDCIEKRFAETNNLLYAIDNENKGVHQCDPDLYKASYEFNTAIENPEELIGFSVTYLVTGKDKNFTSVTNYSRVRNAI